VHLGEGELIGRVAAAEDGSGADEQADEAEHTACRATSHEGSVP
jgi:hypothetical protein